MKARMNLATKPLQVHRRFYVFSGVAGAIALIAFLGMGLHIYKVRKAEASFRTQRDTALKDINQLLAEREELENFFSQPENARLHERAGFINTILDARSFNWTRMFMDLERVLPVGVRVMNIEPKQVNGLAAVKLTVGAVSEEAKQKFLAELQQSDAFSHLQLVNVRPAGQDSLTDQVIVELTLVYSKA